MSKTKILIVNAAGYIGGDVAMLLLGLPYLEPAYFHIYAVSAPRGQVYEFLCELPHVTMIPMEVGGSELHPPSRLGKPLRAAEALLTVPRVTALVKREKIDVLYTIDRTVGMTITYVVSLLTGRPLVLNAQITHYLATSRLHQRVIKHAHKITVSSEAMHRAFLPYVPDPGKLVTIPNAIKFDRYDPTISGAGIRTEWNIPADAPVVVLAGRLSPFKGQDDLIRAAALVLKERPDTYFLLAGGENVTGFLATLEHLIAELNVGHRVKLIGHRADLPAVFACATVATMPSHEEPFGLVALEAMAMGKPVVATRAGGVPEFLVDGEMGILIEPRDYHALARALLTLINDPERAQMMGLRGRNHVETYYTDKIYGKQIAALFSEIADRNVPMASRKDRAA